jgi:hypothetical protein
MKRFSIILTILLAMVLTTPLWGGVVADEGVVKAEATKGFEHILDLWREGKFGELYDRTLISGKDTRESFARRMSAARLKPSCCWEKMQDVSVMIKSSNSVVIRAKIGLDATGEMEYKTKAFKLINEFGEWRISRSDILSLAEAKSAKKTRKHKVTKIQ